MAKANISTRPAEEGDAKAIARLATELGYPSTEAQLSERLAKIMPRPDHALLVAVVNDNEVIGWIHLIEIHAPEVEPRAEITTLVVDSLMRSAGAGRLLVERGEAWARERGLRFIGVRSNIIRDRAHSFYLKLGYKITKSQKVFRKPL